VLGETLRVVRDRGRAGGRHRIANLRRAFSSTWGAAPSDMWSRHTRGRYSCSSSTSEPAMGCTPSRPAWPGGCFTCTIGRNATFYH
jgi:hypothetical protein